MKLIDILARELDEWPAGAVCAVQGKVTGTVALLPSMPCASNCFGGSQLSPDDHGDWWHEKPNGYKYCGYVGSVRHFNARLADDHATAIITREQWEEARKALKEYESLDWVELSPGLACSGCVPPIDDPVNSPSHYTHGDIECIDALKAQLTPEEFRGFCKGSVAKYVWRERYKGGSQSLQKAAWYLDLLTQAESEG